MRQTGHLPRGTQGVRLELELQDQAVLLSDYDAWYIVLNQGYLALNRSPEQSEGAAEFDDFYRRFDAAVADSHAWPPPEPWHTAIVASWERIFDSLYLLHRGIRKNQVLSARSSAIIHFF